MSIEPVVSLGIRGQRGGDFARQAIESALAQGYENIEVIIGDESGELEAIARSFGDPWIRYKRSAVPLGPDENARRVFSRARGRFVGLLDEDDRLLPGFLKAVLETFEADATLGVVFTNHLRDVGGTIHPHCLPFRAGRNEAFLLDFLRFLSLLTSSVLMRREVWGAGVDRLPSGQPPRHLWSSVVVNAAAEGWPFFCVDQPLMVHHIHKQQLSADTVFMRESAIGLWGSFEFADPECEWLRRSRLSQVFLSRAVTFLEQGRVSDASVDLQRAAATSPSPLGWRGLALRVLARQPRLFPAARALKATLRQVREATL